MKKYLKFAYKKLFSPAPYKGPIASWQMARTMSQGYDNPAILDSANRAMQKVVTQQAYAERDGTALTSPIYREGILLSLSKIARQLGRPVTVVDIGGALGTLYYQGVHWLGEEAIAQWLVVEQPAFAELGVKQYQNDKLSFSADLTSALNHAADVIILSSSLQYFEDPYQTFASIIAKRPQHIIYDRLPCSSTEQSQIMLQHARTQHYSSTYPVWLLSESRLHQQLSNQYKQVAQFQPLEDNIMLDTQQEIYFAGAFWLRHYE